MASTQVNVYNYGGTSGVGKINREDLASKIADLFADDVPFFAMAQKVRASATKHEWIVDSLASISRTTAKEGAALSYTMPTAPSRVSNMCSILLRNWDITFTQLAVEQVGGDAVARQVMKAMKSLLRDYESVFLWSATTAIGATNAARVTAGLFKRVTTNATSLGSGAGSSARVQLTENSVNKVLQLIWNQGGDPRALFCGGHQKRVISQKFSSKTGFTWNIEASTRTAIQNINKYEGSFGTLDIIPDRNMMASRVAIVTPEQIKVAILRDIQQYKGASTASSVKGWVEAEMTLNYGNEKAHGAIRYLKSTGAIS